MEPNGEKESAASSTVLIRQADTPEDLAAVIQCFHAYTEWLDEDLSHQNYASELASLPGKYAPPTGCLLLAVDSAPGTALGCVALRPLQLPSSHPRAGRRCAEMKRLFVYPEARGNQVARKLLAEVIRQARDQGYEEVFLDTLARMEAAIKLYKSEGFVEADAYNNSPYVGMVYLAKRLD
ncbi:acetyltransferase [Cordyceps fumosorosea ARSEF 2679]|uniref:Acetyltransferase n=1 Tax=Cordyceps fumosorosea (strain ARSEF 2679) TaxID=1081104 RepID=A0A167SZD9_CORFA|nr:acetyltransferase [Cordyceps fumosorosea ARSEF 2679]OAA60087.1 acetyltransferase [Cordyceps fumosorosea ARSEF 2679]